MKHIVAKLLAKSRYLPTDLPLNDITGVKEYIGTAGCFWKIYRSYLVSTSAVSVLR